MRRLLACAVVWVVSFASAADMEDLHAKISAVCPIHGVSGNPADPSGIRIDFKPEATDEQRKAAFAVRNAFDYRESGLADLDKQLDRLLIDAANRASLDEASFSAVYLRVQRAKLVRSPEGRQRLVSEILKSLKDAGSVLNLKSSASERSP